MSTQFRKKLPPNCCIDKGKYVRFRKQIKGVKHDEIIGTINDDKDKLLQAYLEFKRTINKKPLKNTLQWLSDKYQVSIEFKELANTTQDKYKIDSKILQFKINKGRDKVKFGTMPLTKLTKPFMQDLMKKKLEEYKKRGYKGEAQVNHEVSYLSSMLKWGINFVHGISITKNPLDEIKKFKAPKNKRYVTHIEYSEQLKNASPLMQAFFEIAYLCACRSAEVRDLKESDDKGDKLLIRRLKGSKDTLITVSPRLRTAIDKAKSLRPKRKIIILNEDRHIFENLNGDKINREGLKSVMARLKKKMIKLGKEEIFWTLHLLKSKGISDAEDKDIAGLTESMKRRYNTKIQTHEAVD